MRAIKVLDGPGSLVLGFLDGLGSPVNDEKMAKDFKEIMRRFKDKPIVAKMRPF